MRILIASPGAAPAHIGAPGAAWWLGRGLSARGHAIEQVADVPEDVERPGADAAVAVGLDARVLDCIRTFEAARLPVVCHLGAEDLDPLGDPSVARRVAAHVLVSHSAHVAERCAELGWAVSLIAPGATAGPLPGGDPPDPPPRSRDDAIVEPFVLWVRSAAGPDDGEILRALDGSGTPAIVAGTAGGLPAGSWAAEVLAAGARRLDHLIGRCQAVVLGGGDIGDLCAVTFSHGRPIIAGPGSDAAAEVGASGAGWLLGAGRDVRDLQHGLRDGRAVVLGRAGQLFFESRRTWDAAAARYEEWLDPTASPTSSAAVRPAVPG